MKKSIVIFSSLLLVASATLTASAQAPYRQTVPYVTPRSAVKVALVVQKEVVKKGPYAKFAQQYLGVTAPLNDRASYEIVSASLSAYNEADGSNIYTLDVAASAPVSVIENPLKPIVVNEKGKNKVKKESDINTPIFADMGINPIVYKAASSVNVDKTTTREKSLEEMAADAANAIFTIRKRRFDLVTGENSDAVFGEGLEAAIAEMRRLEDEYLSLFVGKKSVETKSFTFDVTPSKSNNNYTVCRFSQSAGVVDPADVSGEVVALVVTPQNLVTSAVVGKSASVKGAVKYTVPDMAICNLLQGTKLIESARLPFYQFGTVVEAAPAGR